MTPVRYPDSLVASSSPRRGLQGLGTGAYLSPTHDIVRGIVVFDNADPSQPNMTILRVRLPPKMHQIGDVICV